MSSKTRRETVLVAMWGLASLPAALAHELTHALASVPWARQIGVIVEPRSGRAVTRIDWRDGSGQLARTFAALAPMLVGLLGAAIFAAVVAANGLQLPSTASGLAKVSVLAMWWAIYTMPSAGDLSAALGGEPDG